MCAVKGTKLYGLRIKKDSQSKNKYQKNIFNGFDLILKKDPNEYISKLKFHQSVRKASEYGL